MRKACCGYEPSKKDTRKTRLENLKFEYSEYLSKLSNGELQEISESNHFQLFNIKILNTVDR